MDEELQEVYEEDFSPEAAELALFIGAGGADEMPLGVARRMYEAGYVHPEGEQALHDLLWDVAFDELEFADVNLAAALACLAVGVEKQ